MRPLLLSVVVFVVLTGGIVLFGFIYLLEPGPEGRISYIYSSARIFLHRLAVVDILTPGETNRLYRSTCTRKCHSTDVIESVPRTAMEWDWIVTRMKAPERGDIPDRQAMVITEYLQKHFLSNTPTILPEKVMRFLRKHLWKSDFGESDLYLDIIYIPLLHRSLIPYLVLNNSPTKTETVEALFVLYINTHQGVIPPWKIAEMAVLRDDKGVETRANRWQVAYVDGQNHHYQGLLSFPVDIKKESGLMEVEVKLPGMRKRIFQWQLPIPLFKEEA
jgi:hypothetical protein